MHDSSSFTLDTTAFPQITNVTNSLHAAHQKLIVVVGPGLSPDDSNSTYYDTAIEQNLLLDSVINSELENGKLT